MRYFIIFIAATVIFGLGGYLIKTAFDRVSQSNKAVGEVSCKAQNLEDIVVDEVKHEKRLKELSQIGDDELRSLYCERVLWPYPRNQCLQKVRFAD